MAGPWEDYKPQAPAQEDGPWADFQPPAAPREQYSISAKPSGAGQWLRDLEADVRYGGTTTMPGRILKKMGAQGLNVGSQGNADTVLQSTPLGPIHAAQGFAEKRPLHAAKGILETIELPLEFVGGPTAGAVADAIPVAAQIAKQTVKQGARAIAEAPRPSAKMTRRLLESVDKAATHEGLVATGKNLPEKLTSLSNGFVGRAKEVYKQLDKAADGNLQPLLDSIEETKHAIEAQKNVDPKKAAKLAKELTRLEGQKTATIAKMTQNGVADAEKLLREADRNYARGKQIERLAKKSITHSGQAQFGGKTNPEKFARSLDTANTIAEVEGGIGKRTMKEFTTAAQKALNTKKRLKYTGIGLAATGALSGIGGGGYAGYKALTD
jgi:hypothetical protein